VKEKDKPRKPGGGGGGSLGTFVESGAGVHALQQDLRIIHKKILTRQGTGGEILRTHRGPEEPKEE